MQHIKTNERGTKVNTKIKKDTKTNSISNLIKTSNLDSSTNNGWSLVSKSQVTLYKAGIVTRDRITNLIQDERGDVPGWVLVVLMTTGLVTAIWAIAKPNLTNILNNSLNSMNSVR